MRKIDWGGAGQIPEALGQDRWGSSLPINRYFFVLLRCDSTRSWASFFERWFISIPDTGPRFIYFVLYGNAPEPHSLPLSGVLL